MSKGYVWYSVTIVLVDHGIGSMTKILKTTGIEKTESGSRAFTEAGRADARNLSLIFILKISP